MSSATEHVDVLIVGAGLSGIGAACHLKAGCPEKSFAIIEARGVSGGTWDLFRYPGVRSDSDMFTLGYSFMPWRGAKAIADGPEILSYVRETADQYGIENSIRYHRRCVRADWSSELTRWRIEIENTDGGGAAEYMTCNFLWMNTGYYRYDEGYTPEFEGVARFNGTVVHPQHWPEDLDYTDKRVVVIGSGATAVTLVPAIAQQAAHVTMLQRSPSYVLALPGEDPVADVLRRYLPQRAAYPIVRWKNVVVSMILYELCRRAPKFMTGVLLKGVAKQLPAGYDVGTHFTPTYDPWDQRLCFVPDGDLFKAIRDEKASVVTDRIVTFTERGLKLASGRELEADIIVTATGLNMHVLGGTSVIVDDVKVELPQTVAYKGFMFCGVPNFATTFGYTNASWTLKADLAADYVCRLLNHMDAHGETRCTPIAPDPSLPTDPFLNLHSGYITRASDILPKQGSTTPWRLHQNYPLDVMMLRYGAVDEEMEFSRG